MRRFFNYLWYVLKHKYYVGRFCLQHGLYWQAMSHDMSKLLPSEFFPYMRHFFAGDGSPLKRRNPTGYYKPTYTGDPAFDRAWLLHTRRNDHHWQYWTQPGEDPENPRTFILRDIPTKCLTEMYCDWQGAAAAQDSGGVLLWFCTNYSKLMMSEADKFFLHTLILAPFIRLITRDKYDALNRIPHEEFFKLVEAGILHMKNGQVGYVLRRLYWLFRGYHGVCRGVRHTSERTVTLTVLLEERARSLGD